MKISTVALSLLAFVLVPAATGVIHLSRAQRALLSPAPTSPALGSAALGSEASSRHPQWAGPRPLDPAKPTVAVLLGADVSEVADVLGPYAAFAASERFNVVTVAPTRQPVALTGGLDVLPDYALNDLDRAPLAAVVIPNLPFTRAPANREVTPFLQRQAARGTLLLSICTGADTLAATGLLDGRRATAHWGDLGTLNKRYPSVQWVTGERYVDAGRFVSSAGLLSGIDASLHVVQRLAGVDAARQAAARLHHPLTYQASAHMPALRPGWRDGVALLNGAFLWDRPAAQVPLRGGEDELALTALFDTRPAMFAATLTPSSDGAEPVATRYGLILRPRLDTRTSTLPRVTLPTGPRPFEQELRALARDTNRPTARYAARRLEYRTPLDWTGAGWWGPATLRPLLLGLLGATLVLVVRRGTL